MAFFSAQKLLSSPRCFQRFSRSPSFFSCISERFVLNELSDLLSIPKTTTPFVEISRPILPPERCDRHLSPTEKLRGVFLAKLHGRSAVHSALSSAGVNLTFQIFADVLNRGNLSGASMVSFFNWAVSHPEFAECTATYNVLFKALGRRKFFGFVEEMLVRMRSNGVNPSLETVEILLDSYISARQVLKAVGLFKNLEDIGADQNTESLRLLLICLCKRSHVRVANSVFNSMKGAMQFNTLLYNEIIGGWARSGKVDKVESLWKLMVADGLEPNNLTYSYLIEALGRDKQIKEAVDVLVKMKEKGCQPDTSCYNAIIFNFLSIGDLDECMKFYNEMLENGCLPDVETYSRFISALLRVRRVADALELLDEMLGRGIVLTTGMITLFLQPLCNFGPPHAAMEVYKKAKKSGCPISLKAYKLLLMRLSRFGKCGTVLKLWEEMQDAGHASDKEVYEYIVNGLCNIGQVDNAVLVVEESLQKGFCLGKVVYSKLNNKLMDLNKVETAYKLLLKVKEARTHSNARSFWHSKGWHF